ncbi:MAG: serine hydrolase [Chthonomonas sp.]|nr:serine hydrolase [Chthonomonas sp.]
MTPREVVERAIADGAFPGAAWAYGTLDDLEVGSAGHFRYDDASPAVDHETIYDVASLTKVVATTSAAMLLSQIDQLDVERPVAEYLPEFAGEGRNEIRVLDLLTHRSGLPAHREYWKLYDSPEAAFAGILQEPLVYEPGTRTEYSCVGFIVLAMLLEKVMNGGQKVKSFKELEVFTELSIFCRLNMGHTTFRPGPFTRRKIPPTEVHPAGHFREGEIQGTVHDENAYFLGGVSGNAGLFSSASDVAKFAQCMLRGGDEIFDEGHIHMWTMREDETSTRAMGWDTKSPVDPSCGQRFGPLSYGHLGFTGCSLWIDPEAKLFGVLLSNRVHPTRDNLKIQAVRPAFYDAVYGVSQ